MKRLNSFFHGLVCCLLLQAPGLRADEITVAVAANFTPVLRELAAAFEENTGHRVVMSTGSSGRLYAQVVNGAPYQVFFSADQEKPAELVKAGLAVPESRFTYATGKLVLWSADPAMQVANGEALRSPDINRVALANPRLAPYGAAAEQVLEKLALPGSGSRVRVTGENITQAYQFVETGNVPVGFIALSQVIDGGEIRRGAGWIIPQDMYDPIRQDAVLLKSAEQHSASVEFLEFVKSDAGKNIIMKFGYGTD